MNIERYSPTEILKPFIKTLMIVESEDGMDSRVLPDTSIVLAFRFRGALVQSESALPSSCISGLRRSLRLVEFSRRAAVLLVVFQEGGAAAFFQEPLHELFSASIALDNLIPRARLNPIEDCLAEFATNRQRIAFVQRFLISEMKAPSSDLLVREAVRRIQASGGALRIRDLATDLHISQDPLEKRFRRVVGTSPKQFSSVVRMRGAIDACRASGSFSEAAHIAGYFDQSHFNKDFKVFTGQAPQAFFDSPPHW